MAPDEAQNAPAILLVEDDETVRDAVSTMLERAGYAVTQAENGLIAAGLIENWTPDLVITDIFMPDGDGIEILSLIKKRRPALPVIAISGGSPTLRLDYLRVADDLGAAATLYKPFAAEDFLATVARVLKGAGHAAA
ncbi:MAG TPA: response regulator [Dongiaceae bacterium]|nr:response regulator [Dongiaceae bacterium]